MRPTTVLFVDGWDLPEEFTSITPRDAVTIEMVARAHLIHFGDCDAMTGQSLGRGSHELISIQDYAESTSLVIYWRFVNSEKAEITKVIRIPRLEEDGEEPPSL